MRKILFHLKAGTLGQTTLRWLRYRVWTRDVGDSRRPYRLHIWCRDFLNRARFGKDAPQFAELIYVNPQECLVSNKAFRCGQVDSAKVIDRWPYQEGDLVSSSAVEDLPIASAVVGILQSCIQHWREGAPWTQTWNYQRIAAEITAHGMFWTNQLFSLEELDERCRNLDALFQAVKDEKMFPLRATTERTLFRQEDSTIIHVGPKGELVVAGLGLHRFSMALILGVAKYPAQIGCVHRNALHVLPGLRKGE